MTAPRIRKPALSRRALLASTAGVSAGLAGCLSDTEYTIGDVTSESPDAALSFDVEVLDPDIRVDSPGAFDLSATNESEGPLDLLSRGVAPFGVLELRGEAYGGDARIRLWSDEYEESPHVDVRPNGMRVDGEVLSTRIDRGETTSFVYEIHGDDVPGEGGVYTLGGSWDRDTATYRVLATADEAQNGTDRNHANGTADSGADGTAGDLEPTGTGANPPIRFEIDARSKIPFVR